MYFSLLTPDRQYRIVNMSSCKEYLLDYYKNFSPRPPGRYWLDVTPATADTVGSFLRLWEASLPVEPCAVSGANNLVKIQFDPFWLQSPALLSAFALFVRIAGRYTGPTLQDFLSQFSSPISLEDKYYTTNDIWILHYAYPRLTRLAEGEWRFLLNCWSAQYIHGAGIAQGVLP